MNIYDEFLKHAHMVDMRANQLTHDMIKELDKAHSIITGKLTTLEVETLSESFIESPHSKKKKLFTLQKQAIEEVTREIFTEFEKITTEAAEDTIAATASKTSSVIISAVPEIGSKKIHLPSLKKWFEVTTVDGLLVNELLGKLEKSTADKIIAAGRQALIQGKGALSMARMIKKQGIAGTYRGIEGISRTLLMSASNYAREHTVRDNYSDVVEGWRHLATLDGKTCLVCASLDHKFYKLDEPKDPLPLHFNCRCVYVPVTKYSRNISKLDRPTVKENFKRMINHRDGTRSKLYEPYEVSKFPGSYQAWLKQQLKTDPDFVRQVLGKKRFELFSQGKITLKRMVTNGRIKRLSEL